MSENETMDGKDWAVLGLIAVMFVLLGLGATHSGADFSGVAHAGR